MPYNRFCAGKHVTCAQIAQLVEQQTENLRVPRSIRGLGTKE